MGFKIGEMFWKVEADTTGFEKGAKSTETKAKSLGKTLTGVGKAVAVGFSAAIVAGTVAISKELITAASNAEETRNKFNVVFGDVQDGASAAADRIRDEFGTSTFETETFLSGVGDITSGLGATGQEALDAAEAITSLGLDINSFANLSGGAEQAVSALTSLFTGEREAAKALGIVINDTNLKQYAEDTGKVFSELTSLEKGFLSLELATTQSQNAIGDAERSADSYANQVKRTKSAVNDLSVALGENLLPAATKVVSAFGKMTRAFADAVTEANNVNNTIEELGEGAVSSDVSLSTLEATLATLNARKAAGSALNYDKDIEKEIAAVEGLISAYGIQDTFLLKANDQKRVLEQTTLDLIRVEEEEAQARQDAADELQNYIDFVNDEYASTEQGTIDALKEKIELFESYAETAVETAPQVQAVLEELREEYEALTEATEDLDDATNEVATTYGDAIGNSISIALGRMNEYREYLSAQKEYELTVLNERLSQYANFYGGISSLIEAFGVKSEAQFRAIQAFSSAEAAVNSYLAFTQVLANPLLGPVAKIAGAGAVLSAGLAQQVKIFTTPVPEFATGGIVQGTPTIGDSVQASLTPGEEVISESDPRHSYNGGSGSGATIILNIDGNTIAKSVINDYVNTGRYLVNLKRGTR